MKNIASLQKMSPAHDPWEAYLDVQEHGKLTLSSIEFTTTYLCNMRCEHCAVGYMLQHKDPDALPIELLLSRLMKFRIYGQSVLQAESRCFPKNRLTNTFCLY